MSEYNVQKAKTKEALAKLLANDETTELLGAITASMADFVKCHEQLVGVVARGDGAAIGQAIIDHVRQSAVVMSDLATTVAVIGTVLDDVKVLVANLHMSDISLETDRLHQRAEDLRAQLVRGAGRGGMVEF